MTVEFDTVFRDHHYTDLGNGWAQAALYIPDGMAVTNPFNQSGPFVGPATLTVTRRPSGGMIVSLDTGAGA